MKAGETHKEAGEPSSMLQAEEGGDGGEAASESFLTPIIDRDGENAPAAEKSAARAIGRRVLLGCIAMLPLVIAGVVLVLTRLLTVEAEDTAGTA